MCPEYLKPARKPPRSSSSCDYTALGLYSRVWQDRHDPCSWDKLFRALSTTSGMWSVIILGLIKMLLKTVSFDHLAMYLISEEHNLGKKHTKNTKALSELEQATRRLWTLFTAASGTPESCRSALQQTAGIAAMKCPWEQNCTKLHWALTGKRSHQRFK